MHLICYLWIILAFFILIIDPNQLIGVMNCELSKISEWLKVNK